ncbi:hypothetical protein OHA40_08435 [Nocardia sp. NBC_00508]|uniref:hypothetical protein n=1 Tax=Nocardia sp. NBC_00508 TaxID=2975992 RepID=UPI002E824119|nr:hypothetical protein [Nocardia sp. NBC_00508]WUD68130.1 hypothetical protein OHA40_08435 [Nocardia sp. NBC_00508]
MEGLNADPAHLIPCAQKGMGIQGEHEGYLKALVAVQDELQTAVTSPGGGQAIQSAMYSAWEKGKALSSSLQQILQELTDGANRIGISDEEVKAQIMAAAAEHGATALGADGVNSVAGDMTQTGTVNVDGANQAVGKVNTLW